MYAKGLASLPLKRFTNFTMLCKVSQVFSPFQASRCVELPHAGGFTLLVEEAYCGKCIVTAAKSEVFST